MKSEKPANCVVLKTWYGTKAHTEFNYGQIVGKFPLYCSDSFHYIPTDQIFPRLLHLNCELKNRIGKRFS